MTAPSDRLLSAETTPPSTKSAENDLSRLYQELLRERDDLNRRLNDALGRLANSDAGAYSVASPGSGPQHDQLVQTFRQLKLQDFQLLSFSLFSIWQKKASAQETKPTYALAWCRQALAEAVLIEGAKLLGIRRTIDVDSDLREVRKTIWQSIQTRFKMRNKPPADLADKLQDTISRSLDLLRAMATATPAACLLVPHHHASFLPELHEAIIGCPDQGSISVRLTVFPGYLVTGSNRLLEKALVYTEEASAKS